jgi:GNAT superfamily N-acetyltransferase
MSGTTTGKVMVRRLTERERPLLEQMYASFAPQGGALGLPPRDAERRAAWLAELGKGINLGAFVDHTLAGHIALMPTGREAEMAVFVHQEFRRRGVATALAEAAVEEARKMGLSSLSVFIDSSNTPARHGLLKFGFHSAWEDLQEAQYVFRVKKAVKAA